MKRLNVILCLLVALLAIACSGGGPGTVDAGPVPGLNPAPPAPGPPAPDPNAGADPGNSLQAALNSATPPGLPANPPPLVSGSPRGQQRVVGAQYNLSAGWNVLSFPMGRLTAASGFRYQLYGYSQGNFFAVDPVNSPQAVDTRLSYFAYADAASTVTVQGDSNDGQVNVLPLNQGWNLIGCPSESQLLFSNMSVSQLGVTRTLAEVAGFSQTSGDVWLSNAIYGLSPDGQLISEDITSPGALPPFSARWVFAFADCELNLNVVAPVPPPLLTGLSASAANAGQTLILSGSGFSTLEQGYLTVGGIPIAPTSIVSWSDTRIELIVPNNARTGPVVVFVNRYPSNPVVLNVGGTGTGTAQMTGLVRSVAGVPLAGAQVAVDTGQATLTAADGTFSLSGIPAGEHLIFAQALGFKRGVGLITFAAGDSRSLLVELSPLQGGGSSGGSGSEQARGVLFVTGKPWFTGGDRYYVSRIDVQEYGNYSNRWNNTWFQDNGDTEYTLRCDGAYIGRSYTIRITWKSAATGDEEVGLFYRTLYQDGQIERFFNP
ncbi:MAG: hypothetical protein AMXMBFR33_34630 [Candidatus Xenobia bacterium]